MLREAEIVASEPNTVAIIAAPILVFAGVVISKVVDFFVAKSKSSGTVRTTEADTLWTASQLFLHDVLDQLKASRDEIVSLRELNKQMQTELEDLAEKNEGWKKRVGTLEDELFDLEERLRREIAKDGPNSR